MYTEIRVPTPAGELYVRDHPGEGPAFVMLHGFPDNLGIFDKLAPLVEESGRRAVAFDFLGFGDSDKPGTGYSFEQQVADVLAVADALHLDRIIPVGHDAGGAVAVNFALAYPERTAEVALLNCFYGSSPSLRFPELILFFATPGLAALSQHFLRTRARYAEIVEFQRAKFREVLESEEQIDYDEFLAPLIDENFTRQGAGPAFAQMTAQLFAEVAREDQKMPELEKLDIFFRVIWGAKDPYLTPAVAGDISKHLLNATTTVLPSAGHWPQIDRPHEVARALLAHADSR
ncbi:Pimeloyl-ACP methyl ester carboxylesterase [Actinacidiphila rubida]|uniref:Pimeloyl-ACP methyl ester carboxylesterase n=2 Tax=Actinacidiphila rubida TaxID=310780 RepID=A0A1H8T9T7_9ACTN|nr:Pimeloyl-ACP methyl ester carboxylesterase [Actinacidiphila rubida]